MIKDRFRYVAIAEGISFLILLFIAMPLKYFMGFPEAVFFIGYIHGFLFILFMVFLAEIWFKGIWGFKKVFIAFILSLLPFGTFWLNHEIVKEKY